MEKSIIIIILLILTTSISLAAEQTLENDDDVNKILFSHISSDILLANATSTGTINLNPSVESRINSASATPPNENPGIDKNKDCPSQAYQVTLFDPCNTEDAKQLWARTKLMAIIGGVGGFTAIVTKEYSNRDNPEYQGPDLLNAWYKNVTAGPVWDEDQWYINYIGHPYFGGVYYQNARKSGYNQWNSFVYSALMSTFLWEYGFEAFAEPPSLQDLFVTPIGGWIYGEWAYNKEKAIIANGGFALGSKFWGSVARFFIDPVGVMGGWFGMKHIMLTSFTITRQPIYRTASNVKFDSDYWGIDLALKF